MLAPLGSRFIPVAVGVMFWTTAERALCRQQDPETLATKEVLRILSDREAYDSAIRPSLDGEATTVKVQMVVKGLSIDHMTMRAQYNIIFRMRWSDPRLAFNNSDVSGVRIRDPYLLWTPDAYFINSDVTHHRSIHPDDFLRVYRNGSVVYSVRLTLQKECTMRLHSFPHDAQECTIEVASYGYALDKLDLQMEKDDVQVYESVSPKPFELLGFDTFYRVSMVSTGNFSRTGVNFRLGRELQPYLSRVYIPTVMMVLISWFSFLLPPEQLLGRLQLALLPLMMLTALCYAYVLTTATVSYTRAIDVFSGISLTTVFATLLHFVVFSSMGVGSTADRPMALEEGSKCVPAISGRLGRAFQNFQRANLPTRYAIIASYIIFLVVYTAVIAAKTVHRLPQMVH